MILSGMIESLLVRIQLVKFMQNLSNYAGLSEVYTNHSIRKTCTQTLDDHDFEARHITALSSHKSESTIKEYATKCSESKKREMFEILSSTIQPKKIKSKFLLQFWCLLLKIFKEQK